MTKSLKGKVLSVFVTISMILGIVSLPVFALDEREDIFVNVTTREELVSVISQTTETPVRFKNLTINIQNDIDLTGVKWIPGYVNGYNGAEVYTVNGNNHRITGLTNSLFGSTWAGKGQLIIKDLTIADSEMSGGVDGKTGFGAFVGHSEATSLVVLENCHLKTSVLTGVDWTGGLIGYAAGYNKVGDGPVAETINIRNCSVSDCTITGGGSTGALLGHATGNLDTTVTINNCLVENNTIECKDSNNKKAGSIMGTVGVGSVYVENAKILNNTVISAQEANNRIAGRFGSAGQLSIKGGKFYDCTKKEFALPDVGTLEGVDTALYKNDIHSVIVNDGSADQKSVMKSDVVTIKATDKEGYDFDGWEVYKGNITLKDSLSKETSFVMGDLDVEISAKWKLKVVKYIVTFDEGNKGDMIEVTKGELVKEYTPEREGYTFKGWYLNDKLFDFKTPITEDIELVAKWSVDLHDEVKAPSVDTTQPVKEVTVGVENTDKAKDIIASSIPLDDELNDKVGMAIDDGKNIKTELVVENVDSTKVDTATKTEIDEKIKDSHLVVAQYLDLSIQIYADDEYLGNVTQLDEPITYTIAVPADLAKEGREFVVVRVHDGVATILPTTMNADGTITFTTDRFSTYALVYKDATVKPNETVKPTTPVKEETVNTGDQNNVALYASLCTLALLGAGIVVFFKKRDELLNK